MSSLGKTDLQALINARIKNSMSNRKTFNPSVSSNGPAGAIQTEYGLIVPTSPPRSPKADRFNTKYLSPGGQTINFTTCAVNTPPTPKFQGKKKGVADVKWDSYDLVYGVAAGPDGKTTNYPKTKESTTWEVSYALDTISHSTRLPHPTPPPPTLPQVQPKEGKVNLWERPQVEGLEPVA